jgi:hypothetical protein
MTAKKLLIIIAVCVVPLTSVWAIASTLEETYDPAVLRSVNWDDLIPEDDGQAMVMKTLEEIGVVQDESLKRIFDQSESSGVVAALDGQRIEIPAFIVPVQYEEQKITAFMLAPYVGACMHSPPPPANQMIFVESEEGIEIENIYHPIYATGIITATSVSTGLADAGYTLRLETTRPYE